MQKTVNPYRNTENDRVLVVLDVRNITARQNQDYCNARIDYGKLLTDTVDGRILIGAIAVDSLIEDSDGRDSARIFHRELKNSGFRLDLPEKQRRICRKHSAMWSSSTRITLQTAKGRPITTP